MISFQEAYDEYLWNIKEDDFDFYWNATEEEYLEAFYYHCSMYDDLKHIIYNDKQEYKK